MHLKCYNTLYDVKSTFKINNKFMIFMSPRSLAIYFQLNLFLKSHQKPPCDVMATSYAAVSGGTKDASSYYHSQLRIRIECAFGMLTHRWKILWSAIPMNVLMKKTVALVFALSKLHKYCIDNDVSHCNVAYISAADEWQNEVNVAVPAIGGSTAFGSCLMAVTISMTSV